LSESKKNMLEKNEKKFCDAHFHYLPSVNSEAFNPPENWYGISCAHSIEEWKAQKVTAEKMIENPTLKNKLFLAYGIHPQQVGRPDFDCEESFEFLGSVLKTHLISAIGECGFDFFSEEYKANAKLQEEYFIKQLELAIFYKKPVIIHCRKANEKLFEYSKLLKQVPAVLFHSFMGTPIEAQSLINKGIKGYFSFGKQIFNNNKKVIDCVTNLPLDSLLFETDAPYQFLKGEDKTEVSEICKIYEGAYKLRKDNLNFIEFSNKIFENLLSLLYE